MFGYFLNINNFFFVLAILFYSTNSSAKVEHVSLNQVMSSVGDLPLFKMNIVLSGQSSVDSGLEFYLVQNSGEEKLVVQQLNQFLILLMGLDKITDDNAKIIVREWQKVKEIQLFDNARVDSDKLSLSKSLSDGAVSSNVMNVKFSKNIAGCNLNYEGKETLWRLGLNFGALWGMNNYAAMLLIFYDNPHAFNNGNINGLKKDAILKCPSEETLEMYKIKQDAKEIFNKMIVE